MIYDESASEGKEGGLSQGKEWNKNNKNKNGRKTRGRPLSEFQKDEDERQREEISEHVMEARKKR